MTAFTDRLVQANRAVWAAMAGHPFVLGLADGTLPDAALQAWVHVGGEQVDELVAFDGLGRYGVVRRFDLVATEAPHEIVLGPGTRVPIEVVQAGVAPAREAEDFAPVPLERTRDTGLRHLAGTLSMARGTPDSATSDFFICLEDLPVLDFGGARNPDGQGFAAFGRVTSGLDVVRRIQAAPAAGQSLTPPVAIVRAFRRP